MDIIEMLRQEELKLRKQLAAIEAAITALNGSGKTAASPSHRSSANRSRGKRRLSAAGRANIIRAAKERWARIRAEKAKKAK